MRTRTHFWHFMTQTTKSALPKCSHKFISISFVLDFFPAWLMPFAFLSEDKTSNSLLLIWPLMITTIIPPESVKWNTHPCSVTDLSLFFLLHFQDTYWHIFEGLFFLGFQSVLTRPFSLGLCSSCSTLYPQIMCAMTTAQMTFSSIFFFFSRLCLLSADWLAFLKNFSLYL